MKDIDGRNVSVIIVGFFALKVAIADLKIPEPPPPFPNYRSAADKLRLGLISLIRWHYNFRTNYS